MMTYKIYDNTGNEDSLLQYIGDGYAHFANGAYGMIYVTSNCEIWFTSLKCVKGETIKSPEPPKFLGKGFIAYYIYHTAPSYDTVIDEYYNLSFQKYKHENAHNLGVLRQAKDKGWKTLFLSLHLDAEKRHFKDCNTLFDYLSKKDKENIVGLFDYYLECLYTNPSYHERNKYDILDPLNLDADWTDDKKDVLLKAMAKRPGEEYVTIDGAHLVWNKEKYNYTLLDYLVGKLFCQDHIKIHKGYRDKDEWIHGDRLSNVSRLQDLFQYKNLGTLRRKPDRVPPPGWQDIDKLF